MRIYEFAKNHGKENKDIIKILTDMGIEVKSHMSSMPEELTEKIEKMLSGAPVETKVPAVKEQPQAAVKTVPAAPAKTPEAPAVKAAAVPEKKQAPAPAKKAAESVHVPAPEPAETAPAPAAAPAVPAAPEKEILEINKSMTVSEFAAALEIKPVELIKKLMGMGVLASMNQVLSEEEVQIIADEYNKIIKFKDIFGDDIFAEVPDNPKDLKPRCPIVTIMGHVDHGKTSLLDAIRESNVVSGEHGGITQKIGAYKVSTGHGDVVFLDTPGHAAFTAMRARGAKATDIVILIVAADDGIMPQTKEAIDHAKAAGAPIIVAINKIDKEGANPDKIKQELTKYGLVPEEWGGKTQVVAISAKKKIGINDLLERILLESEMLELKTNPDTYAQGVVIEGRLDKGRGAVGTVLLQKGTLKIGDAFITNYTYGKVRAIFNDQGKRLKDAKAVIPVEVLGFEEVPNAGDKIKVFPNDKEVKQIAAKRSTDIRRFQDDKKKKKMTLEDLHKKIESGAEKKLQVIIKGDGIGSVEALSEAIEKISSDNGIQVQVIHKDVGDITESDVLLADASDAVVIGFFVSVLPAAKDLAKQEGVEIKIYHIIYEVVDSIKAAMEGLLEPEYELVEIGEAEVRQVFKVESENVNIAGSYMRKGKAYQDSTAAVKRNGYELLRAEVKTLKRFKDTVKEVKEGYEFGVVVEGYKEPAVGDTIIFFEERQKLKKL
ncbi:MAG TPA: translation initiation factor IF-2 [Candidatus Goldiibacteriota bacterium]|nr:translation initiation factor IF-2 [Candidatus Goldiibacteriota bacterium]HPN63770.1 translation initiation factor IF-2 [Candidatus Goldiibacteriota bacterium]HRQ43454.1 translation initiation factor IF-2 [Candidatus Goldiibacteriota bacterium]